MNFKLLLKLTIFLINVKFIISWQWRLNGPDCGRKPSHSVKNYIVGGQEAVRYEFPFLVLIKLNGNTVCGGAIINNQWVVTAAHCFKDREHQISDYTVHAGAHGLHDGDVYHLSLIRVHNGFSFIEMSRDICLIKMDRAFQFGPKAGTICVPTIPREEVSGVITVAGWGRLKEKASPAQVLQKVNLPVITDNECSSRYADKGVTIYWSNVCTYLEGHDTCEGDSGGPAFQYHNGRFVLVGIVSFGWECADKYPGVYTQVSYYVDWIRKSIRG